MLNRNHIEKVKQSFFPQRKPLVSIITVVLNGEKYIESTITSVLSQLYPLIEYIIIDGGSTDGTLEIIKKYENKIAKWISEPDDGISDAFNKGIKLSKGEIIGIINSDDWLEPDAIEKIVKKFNSENPDIICGAVRFWQNEREVNFSYPDLRSLNRETSIHHSSVFIKKSVYDKYGLYDNKYLYAMDYELLLRMKMNGAKFLLINDILSNRRLEGKSYTSRKSALQETRVIRSRYFSKLNIWITYLYVWVKDLIGRILKESFLKSFYVTYWNSKNKKLYGNPNR